MIIALAGPPCSGKTTTAKILANKLGMKFLDTDYLVESASGCTIPEIFAEKGETVFRKLEKQELLAALKNDNSVIALGGGTLIDPDTLQLVMSQCTVFTLTAPAEVLTLRNNCERPLATNDQAFRNLLAERNRHYLNLPGRIDVSQLSPEETAQEICRLIRKEALSR